MATFKSAFFIPIFLLLSFSSFTQVMQTGHVESELIPEVKSIQPGVPFWITLRLEPEKNWHTYWINPGDAGLRTKIEWNLPEGFKAGEILWPYPQKIYLGDLANFGYEDEVFLLTKITPPENLTAGRDVTIGAEANWLVCNVECLPGKGKYNITLPVKNEKPENIVKWKSDFDKTRADLPVKKSDWKITASKNNSGIKILIQPPDGKTPVNKIEFFPYEGGVYNNAASQNFTKTGGGYSLQIPYDDFRVKEPDNLKGILVSDYGWTGKISRKALEVIISFNK